MSKLNETKFAEIMATIGAVFSPLNDIQLDIYYDCLKEFSLEDITFAAKHILKTKQFTGKFPSVADFLQAIENQFGSIEERAELAWAALLWGIQHVGHNQSIAFEDPLIHDTVRALGGWLRVCSADGDVYNEDWFTKNLQWRKKDFITMYKALAPGGSTITYLIGLNEQDNKGKYDFYNPPITFITGRTGQYQISHTYRQQLEHDQFSNFGDLTKKLSM